jgi:flavin reductase (DIM6/NTAB) family NADH-FMN oxidoreductase RutF
MFFRTADGMRPAPLSHNPLNALVCPRPIAWVSTVSIDGTPNLAPFSYFNAVSAEPPFVMFAPNAKSSGQDKDSYANLRAVPEFVVSLVARAQAEQMNATSRAFAHGEDEFARCAVTATPSSTVRPPRVASSRAALECTVHEIVGLPTGDDARASFVVIGAVIGIYIEDSVIEHGRVSEAALDPLSRLGYLNYAALGEIFAMPRPY